MIEVTAFATKMTQIWVVKSLSGKWARPFFDSHHGGSFVAPSGPAHIFILSCCFFWIFSVQNSRTKLFSVWWLYWYLIAYFILWKLLTCYSYLRNHCRDGFFFAVKEVSLLDQGDQGKQSVYQLEQVTGLHLLYHIILYFYNVDHSLMKNK
jgi:hypothetical protein